MNSWIKRFQAQKESVIIPIYQVHLKTENMPNEPQTLICISHKYMYNELERNTFAFGGPCSSCAKTKAFQTQNASKSTAVPKDKEKSTPNRHKRKLDNNNHINPIKLLTSSVKVMANYIYPWRNYL